MHTNHRALLDIVCDDPSGMSEISDLDAAKAIVREIAPNTKMSWLLRRIAASRFPDELLAYLPEIYGHAYNSRYFQPLMMELHDESDFDPEMLQMIVDHYWSLVVMERIVRGDFRRAWDEIRRSFRGFEETPYEAWDLLRMPTRYPSQLAASLVQIEKLVDALYVAMCNKQLIIPIESIVHIDVCFEEEFSSPPGILFAVATGGYYGFRSPTSSHGGTFNRFGRRTVMIAKYFVEKRKVGRREKVKRLMQERSQG